MIPQQEGNALHWRKSTRSGNSGGECVELALVSGGSLVIRDSKSPGAGVIVLDGRARAVFLTAIKVNRF